VGDEVGLCPSQGTVQDRDRHARPEDAAQLKPLVEMSDKELPASGLSQDRSYLLCIQAVGVGLDDSSADSGSRLFLKESVVLRDGGEIDREDRAGASGVSRRWVEPSGFQGCRAEKLHAVHLG
jgi:hypothetical protein